MPPYFLNSNEGGTVPPLGECSYLILVNYFY